MREYHKQMDNRMFDFSGFYSRIAEELPDNAVIAEAGIADGSSSVFLAERLLNLGKSFHFRLIDSLAYGGPDQLNTILRHVTMAGLGHVVEILPFESLAAACRFPDGLFDFVFLDSSHEYEHTKAEILVWYRKVKDGGTLAGHDYLSHPGVRSAVDELIPKKATRITRTREFHKAERILQVEETEQGHGVWWVQKRPWINYEAHIK